MGFGVLGGGWAVWGEGGKGGVWVCFGGVGGLGGGEGATKTVLVVFGRGFGGSGALKQLKRAV